MPEDFRGNHSRRTWLRDGASTVLSVKLPPVATKKPDVSKSQANVSALTHNPFAQLAERKALVSELAIRTPPCPTRSPQPLKPLPCKVRLRHETKGRSGKVVTRITGLPEANLEAIASRLRKALGCSTVVEGVDVLLTGSLAERASEWLDRAGDLCAIVDEPKSPPKKEVPKTMPSAMPLSTASSASGTKRGEIRRGQRVAIVLKADQATGRLTEGVVRDLLTNSSEHPRGIKVRLESGEVGRVKVILERPMV